MIFAELVERKCGTDGLWDGRPGAPRATHPNGWTNFSTCYSPEMAILMKKLYANGDEDAAKVSS